MPNSGNSAKVSPGNAVLAWQQFVKTVSLTSAPERLTSVSTYARVAILSGKTGFQTNNSAVAFVGPSGGDGGSGLAVPVGPSTVTLEAPLGTVFDLNALFADVGVNGEGVCVTYLPE